VTVRSIQLLRQPLIRRLQRLYRQIHFAFWLIFIRYCQDIPPLSLVFPICPVFLFMFYSLVNRANLPIIFVPFIPLQIFRYLCVFIPYYLHFKFGVQEACCFSICILLFLFIHTTAPLILCMFVSSFVCSFINSSVHLCVPSSFQFVFVSVSSIPIHISIIPVVPHYKLGSFAYSGFRHSS